jgi:peptide/nickel transport system ATP-binding protein/oligopeptide transport system ATP-binding protein
MLAAGMNGPLVRIAHLRVHYRARGGALFAKPRFIRAVDDVTFDIAAGETLGLVGESGCGKSTLGRAILALRAPTGGEVSFDGRQVFTLDAAALKSLRREMQLVFQDPFASLDPRKTVGRSVRAALDIHGVGTPAERDEQVERIFARVGLHRAHIARFPHEFSGGQRQRVGLARALVLRPRFLVCDEPVSALDVSIQAQILNLLKDLQAEFGLTLLFISHNLAVVEHIADRVAVMYYGRIVELAPRDALFGRPLHPYTQGLLDAVPVPDPANRSMAPTLEGEPPDPADLPAGCRFRSRCRFAMPRCAAEEPDLLDAGGGHQVACWLPAAQGEA